MITLHVPGELKSSARESGKDLSYTYPGGLNLLPGSELHELIRTEVMERAQLSYDIMKNRHSDWNYIDQSLTAYIKASDYEENLKAKNEDVIRKAKPISVVVPYTYATLETLLTYLVSAFLDSPYFRYEPTSSEDAVAVALMEGVVDIQTRWFKTGLALHTLFRDGLAYGFGYVDNTWDKKFGRVRTRTENGESVESEMLYEGNKLLNTDPYLFLPDPTIPIHNFQEGEFVGRVERTNYTGLLNLEARSSDIFNVRYMRDKDGRTQLWQTDQSKRNERMGTSPRESAASYSPTSKPVDVVYMYIDLIPADWKLGDGEYPEKWMFAVAGDQYVIMAKPLDLDHNMYPGAVFAPDYDGYSLAPISRLEINSGMQTVLDFLFNSHIENVRKAINDMLVVDPFLLNMADFDKPGAGRLLRLRRAAWGRGVENSIMQLPVVDVTRGHMQDLPQVMDLMSRTSASVDSLQGVMRKSGERRSATESRDTRMSALSRLARIAKVGSIMTMYDLGYMHAGHTKQFMEKSVIVDIVGRRQRDLLEEYGIVQQGVNGQPAQNMYMKADVDALKVPMDVTVADASVGMGETAEDWIHLFQIAATRPEIGVGMDMIRMFKHIARMLGAKNLNEFVKLGGSVNIQTAQMESIMNEKRKGNLVPLQKGGEGGGYETPTGGS